MEQIKDKVTLRAFAYDQAMRHGTGATTTLNIAKDIENYILGEATLPEVCDTDAHLKEFSKILRENTSRPLFSLSWISTEIVPKDNQQVLVMCKDRKYPLFGKYLGDGYWEVSDAGTILQSKFNEVTVVAWLPIPEYNGSTL